MFEKILHGGNFAACFGAIATTAADLGICGGTATGISAVLSAHAIIKKDKTLDPLAQQMGAAFEAAVKASPLPSDTKKLIPQLMRKFPVTEEDIAKGILEPAQVAAIVRARIESARGKEDPALTGEALVRAYEAILTQMLTPVLAAPVGMEPMQWAIQRQLLAQTAITGATKRMFEEGVTEKAIIGLAQKIAAETENVGQAWVELQNAMEMAVRVQADGRVTSNQGGFVDEVLHRVAELSAEGEYGSAGDEIDAALSREEEESQARRMKLLARGVEVALLDRDTVRAAALVVWMADLDAGGAAEFQALRGLQDFYYERGRDKGINLDLELSIDLAALVKSRARTSDERSVAFDDLGTALQTIGERESRPDRLEAAVRAFEVALEERTRERAPLKWAATQNNLGNALQILGTRESGTTRLEAAISSFEAALMEWTREKVPLEWATTQNNLGNALQVLGMRENSTAQLEAAVKAYENTLEEWTRESVPLKWAATQNNLGNTLSILGRQENDTERLEKAVLCYEAAFAERTQEKVPLDWAMTQNNLGNVLKNLGERESGTARLEAAVKAFEAALEERTREKVPLDWAGTQSNLANVEMAFFDKTHDVAHLDQAEWYAKAAREVFVEAQASQYLAMIDQISAMIKERRDGV
jgi:tetratricopeptide (TPR) repeat protein